MTDKMKERIDLIVEEGRKRNLPFLTTAWRLFSLVTGLETFPQRERRQLKKLYYAGAKTAIVHIESLIKEGCSLNEIEIYLSDLLEDLIIKRDTTPFSETPPH